MLGYTEYLVVVDLLRSSIEDRALGYDLETVEALLPTHAPPSDRTNKIINDLLVPAAENGHGHAHIIRYLLSLDHPKFEISHDVVRAAIGSPCATEIYFLLLERQPSIFTFGWERSGDALILAIFAYDLPFITFLLKNGADPGWNPVKYDWRYWDRSVPLEVAVLRSQTETIRPILWYGACIHPTEALQWAARDDKLDVLELLLESGADIGAIVDDKEVRLY
ncbi:MAG: hypothetical protein MMC33_004384 [Icmadophila ericetorum]|nr:hypothetical protein [Icmadophila ericetorum]